MLKGDMQILQGPKKRGVGLEQQIFRGLCVGLVWDKAGIRLGLKPGVKGGICKFSRGEWDLWMQIFRDFDWDLSGI